MSTGEPDELEKIAQLAVQRGYWDARAALEGVAMARLHTSGPQKTFLKKLLERTRGLTYDELARLEKDALAPPVSQTPSKPLPRLGSAKPASSVKEALASPEVVIPPAPKPAAPPAPPPPAETYTPPSREQTIVTPKPLPRLNAPKKPPAEPPPG